MSTWLKQPIVWDDSALKAFAPPTTPTPAPTTRAPTRSPTPPPLTAKPTKAPTMLYAARTVPAIATLESTMHRGMFLKMYSNPEGGMAGTTTLDTTPQEWHIGRGATVNSLVFRAGSSTGPVLSAGPGTECALPVVWTSSAGVRSQFIVNSTEENPDAYVISTIAQNSTGACADGKVRYLATQPNGTLRLEHAAPNSATLLSYLWIIRPANMTPAPTFAPSPTPEATVMPYTPSPQPQNPNQNINITLRDESAPLYQYPVAPDLLVGGSIDPLLMSVVTDTPSPTPAATVPVTETPEPELDFDAIIPTMPPTSPTNWTKWIVIVCCVVALAVGAYVVYGKTKGKKAGGNNTGGAANNLGNLNLGNDLGDFGNLNLGNNGNNANLGAPPATSGRKS